MAGSLDGPVAAGLGALVLYPWWEFRFLPVRRLFVVLLLLLGSPVARADWDLVTLENREYVPLSNVASFYQLRFLASGPANHVHLVSPGRSLRGAVNSKEFYINEVKFILSYPLLASGDTVFLSRNDLTKLIEPVLRPHRLRNLGAVRTIILDPGHGGHDRGAVSAHGFEKDFALDVALRIRDLLQRRRGYKVLLTRTDDTFIPLEERTRIANQFRDTGIFVAIHFNAGSGIGTGIETYLMAPRLVPSYNGDGAPTLAELQQWPGNAHDPENMALATAMHSAMLSKLPLYDRGIKRARFHVLRENILPSVLVEGGFVSNDAEARKIAEPSYRQALADAIVVAIENFRSATEPAAQGAPNAPIASGGAFGEEIDRIIKEAQTQKQPAGPKVNVPNRN